MLLLSSKFLCSDVYKLTLKLPQKRQRSVNQGISVQERISDWTSDIKTADRQTNVGSGLSRFYTITLCIPAHLQHALQFIALLLESSPRGKAGRI